MSEHKYTMLANRLRTDIQNGVYAAGARMPSENDLIGTYGFSRQTVRQAMQILEDEGLAQRLRGSGTYVRDGVKTKSKSYNVGIITTYIREYIFPAVLEGIEKEMSDHHYASILAATNNRVDNERRVLLDFLQRPVDGLIIEGTKTALPNPNIDLYRKINEMHIPMVFINGFYSELVDPVYVVTDDRQGGYDACSFLLHKGRRKLCGIFKSDDMQGHERYAGMMAALIDRHVSVSDDHLLWFTTGDHAQVLERAVLETVRHCDGVVCYNDEVAVTLMRQLEKEGMRVPEDVAVISFDNSIYAGITSVPITSLDHPKEKLGALAAKKLINLMNGEAETSSVLSWGFSEKQST
ncbi:MAG: GntR family transcriptional regulator [Clostridia bacterium]|nr:GntR family transcriptional regulator [Clostridia bacterium]